MSIGWDRIQRLARRVVKEGHPDREVQQSWADELAVAVLHAKQPSDLKDITAPKHGVQVEIRADGTVLWVHVDGITQLRICQIESLEMVDNRPPENRWTTRELVDLAMDLEGKSNAVQESGATSDGEEGREVGVEEGALDGSESGEA